MKTFFDNNDYNIETDGAIKNVNGAAMFIPFMTSTDDVLYKKYITEISSRNVIFISHNQ